VQQARQQHGAHEGLIEAQRVGDRHHPPPRVVHTKPQQVGPLLVREAVLDHLSQPCPYEQILNEPPRRLCSVQAPSSHTPRRQRGRDAVQPVHPCHLFDQVDLPLQIGAEAGDLD
jgi:hypothetical protein